MSIRKIANRLKVSPSTVSLALRGDVKISKDTRNRVQAEANRIGYRPDGKLNEMMAQLRYRGIRETESCIGVLTFNSDSQPWGKGDKGKQLLDAMKSRAERLGYRLELFRVNEPGMSLGRLKRILETRRIEGLLCFGDQGVGVEFPKELQDGSVVCVGLGFEDKLNTVARDYFGDLTATLGRGPCLWAKRVALVVDETVSQPVAQRYQGAYLAWSAQEESRPTLVYNQRGRSFSDLKDWLFHNKPDAVVYAGGETREAEIASLRDQKGRRLQIVSMDLDEERRVPGMLANFQRTGEAAIDMLIKSVACREFGQIENPKLELVRSEWLDTDMNNLTGVPQFDESTATRFCGELAVG